MLGAQIEYKQLFDIDDFENFTYSKHIGYIECNLYIVGTIGIQGIYEELDTELPNLQSIMEIARTLQEITADSWVIQLLFYFWPELVDEKKYSKSLPREKFE